MSVTADAQLMAKIAQGDRNALQTLMTREMPKIYALAERMTGDREEAQDIVQEAYIKLWKHAADWRPEAKVSTWLYRIVSNMCIDRIRKPKHDGMDELPEIQDDDPGPYATLDQKQKATAVRNAIEALPDRQRAALVLFHYQEMSMHDIATSLNMTHSAVEGLLYRARKNLAKLLVPQEKPGLKQKQGGAR